MNLNVTFDQPISSLPAGFVSAVNYVVSYYDSVFSNNVTVNIDVGYGEIGGDTLDPGVLGESQASNVDPYSYAQIVAALKANEPSGTQQSAYATLPATSPLGRNGRVWLVPAEEKALGLIPANGTAVDGYVGFSTAESYSYSPTATPGPNQFYFVGVVEHEISEVMGRVSYVDNSLGPNAYSVMDLFRWKTQNTRQLSSGGPAYFSIDSGATNLDSYNTDPSGDLGDWADTAGRDSYLAFSSAGVINPVTPVDLEVMNILGWDPATSTVSGTVLVSAGQTSAGLSVVNGGAVVVLSGGTAIGTAVSSGGADYVSAGGTANGTTVLGGGDEFVETGGLASGTTINGGTQTVYGTASGTVVNSGSFLYLEAGVTVGAVVASGVEVVLGTASGTAVGAGGFDFVFAGGTATATTVTGGDEYIETGAQAIGTTVNGGAQIVYGTATGTVINGGAFDYLQAGGTASATVIDNGVDVINGVARVTVVSSSGDDYVEPGGSASGTVLNGGREFIEMSGTTISTTANGGAQIVYGIADATVLNGGAFQYLQAGGSANGTLANNGVVVDFGTANATVLQSAGFDFVEAGGSAAGTVVIGGDEYVEAAGTAIGTTISAGGQIVYGTAVATVIDGGGIQYVSAGGVASATQIDGGYEYVASGGIVSGATISGGTLELTAGAIAGAAPLAFAAGAGGTLRLDDSQHFAGTVAGFGLPDQIDLADIAFGAGTVFGFQEADNNTSGTLTVSNGAAAANLTLLGQYVAGQFHIASDGHGGTLVSDPPLELAGHAATLAAST